MIDALLGTSLSPLAPGDLDDVHAVQSDPGSVRVAEKAGLALVWQGPSKKGPERLILTDRELPTSVLDSLIALG